MGKMSSSNFDYTSILSRLPCNDATTLRRVMNALMLRLVGVTDFASTHDAELLYSEAQLVNSIIDAVRGNQLLRTMVARFASFRYTTSAKVIEAAVELDEFATEAVQTPSSHPQRTYIMAQNLFYHRVQAESPLVPGGENKYGDIALGTEEEEIVEHPGIGPSHAPDGSRLWPSSTLIFIHTREKQSSTPTNFQTLSEDEESCKIQKADVEGQEDPNDSESSGSEVPQRRKFAPHTIKSDIFIEDGKYDRDVPKLGKPDDSKLTITLRVKRPAGNGQFVHRKETWRYNPKEPLDWSSKYSVGKFIKWRQQIFYRAFGPKNRTRDQWLQPERNLLQSLIERHLDEVASGRWSRIDWNAITVHYHQELRGVIQKKGQLTAERSYSNASGRRVQTLKARCLWNNRSAPTKTMDALKLQSSLFTDLKCVDMIRKAKMKDAEVRIRAPQTELPGLFTVPAFVSSTPAPSDTDTAGPELSVSSGSVFPASSDLAPPASLGSALATSNSSSSSGPSYSAPSMRFALNQGSPIHVNQHFSQLRRTKQQKSMDKGKRKADGMDEAINEEEIKEEIEGEKLEEEQLAQAMEVSCAAKRHKD